MIGATTENPYFEVNSALLSRCQIYELHPLEPEQVEDRSWLRAGAGGNASRRFASGFAGPSRTRNFA